MHLLHVGQEGGALRIVADGIANGFIGSSPCGCYNAIPSYSLQAFAVAVTVDTLRAVPLIRVYLSVHQLNVAHNSRHNLGVSRVFHASATHIGQQVGVIFCYALCGAIAHTVPVAIGHDGVAEQIVGHVLSAVIARYHRVVVNALRALLQTSQNFIGLIQVGLLRQLQQVASLQSVAQLQPFLHIAAVHHVALAQRCSLSILRLAKQFDSLIQFCNTAIKDGFAIVVGRHRRVAQRLGVRYLAIHVEHLHEAHGMKHVGHRHIVVSVFCLCLIVQVVKVRRTLYKERLVGGGSGTIGKVPCHGSGAVGATG